MLLKSSIYSTKKARQPLRDQNRKGHCSSQSLSPGDSGKFGITLQILDCKRIRTALTGIDKMEKNMKDRHQGNTGASGRIDILFTLVPGTGSSKPKFSVLGQ